MSLKHRRILYICFFVIFFIAAPLVVLWAEGYRYDWGKHRLLKTGVLFLESKPSKAEIYLDGKIQKDKTTARIKNLLPNKYQIEIKKEGYTTWQKKLNVSSGQTTFAQYVRLFKTEPVIKNIFSEKILLSSEQNENLVAVIIKNKKMPTTELITPLNPEKKYILLLFNLDDYSSMELVNLKYLPEKIELSPQRMFVHLKYPVQYEKCDFIFAIHNKSLIDIESITQKEILFLRWADNLHDENIFVNTQNDLEKINLITKKSILLLKKPMADFYLINNQLFYLEKKPSNVSLNSLDLNNPTDIKIITTLPVSDDYEFQDSPENILGLLDKKNKILYLINTNQEKNKIKILSDIEYIKWQGKNLILGNKFEIFTYNTEKNEEKLNVRLGEEIKKYLWYPINTHIIYLINNEIRVMESVDDQPVLQTLVKKNDIQNVFINNKGDKLYFLDNAGINEAEIQ